VRIEDYDLKGTIKGSAARVACRLEHLVRMAPRPSIPLSARGS